MDKVVLKSKLKQLRDVKVVLEGLRDEKKADCAVFDLRYAVPSYGKPYSEYARARWSLLDVEATIISLTRVQEYLEAQVKLV
jgi:hypothetical protein